jgi:hypothetical protein
MPARSPNDNRLKAAVSVSEMARMCGLSRSHFNFLIRTGVMPQPVYNLSNRRPLFDREHQEMCLRVKETNTGIDGRYVVFYARRRVTQPPAPSPSGRRASRRQQEASGAQGNYADLVDGLRALGLAEVTAADLDVAVRACFPAGYAGSDEGEVLRTLWRHLRRPEAVR